MDVDLLTRIAFEVIAPVIVIAGLGFLLGRWRVLEPEPIARIYMVLFAPALAFVNVTDAGLSGEQFGQVFLFSFVSVGVLLVLATATSLALRHDRGMRGAFANSVVLYNSANFGLPVQKLAFPGLGGVIQPIVLLSQNAVAFTLGMFNAASNSPGLLGPVTRVVKMPLTWAVVVGLACRWLGITTADVKNHLPMLWVPIDEFQKALVPVALLSLGVQLSRVTIYGKILNIILGTVLRLVGGPLVGLAVGLMLGIQGDLLAVLVVSVSFPTAVFTSVLATEFRNQQEYAAANVFVSTVASILTVTATIYLVQTRLAVG